MKQLEKFWGKIKKNPVTVSLTLAVLLALAIGLFVQYNSGNNPSVDIKRGWDNFNEISSISERFDTVINTSRESISKVGNFIASGNSLILLIGGMVGVILVVPLIIIFLTFRKNQQGSLSDSELPPEKTEDEKKYIFGSKAGISVDAKDVDDIINSFNYMEDAKAKLVKSGNGKKIVRIENCRGCNGSKNSKTPVCSFELGFFEGAFNNLYHVKEIKEKKCKAMGSDCCEFEIKTNGAVK